MKIFNLTPHVINVYSQADVQPEIINGRPTGKFIANPDSKPVISYESVGMARCSVNEVPAAPLEDGFNLFPVVKKTFSDVTGIPCTVEPEDVIIVSAIVGNILGGKVPYRVLGPGSIVLKDGQIVGCLGLSEF